MLERTKMVDQIPRAYQARIFVITFLAYTCFHMSRKPQGMVASILHPQSPIGESTWNPVTKPGYAPFNQDVDPRIVLQQGMEVTYKQDLDHDSHPHGYKAATGDYKCRHKMTKTYRGAGATPAKTISYCTSYYRDSGDAPNDKCCLALANYETMANNATHIGRHCGKKGTPAYKKWTASGGCWFISCGKGCELSEDKHKGDGGRRLYRQYFNGTLPAAVVGSSTEEKYWYRADKADAKADDLFVEPVAENGKVLLGLQDTYFLLFYAFGLFCAGHIGDRVNLRWFLPLGMIGSGAFVALIGAAQRWGQHSTWYFGSMYAIQGLFQAIGWPSVVAVMGRWFGHNNRGLIMGLWNCHTSVGNMLGSGLSGDAFLIDGATWHGGNWPAAFYLCGGIIAAMGVVVFVFVIPRPQDAGFTSPNDGPALDHRPDSLEKRRGAPGSPGNASMASESYDNYYEHTGKTRAGNKAAGKGATAAGAGVAEGDREDVDDDTLETPLLDAAATGDGDGGGYGAAAAADPKGTHRVLITAASHIVDVEVPNRPRRRKPAVPGCCGCKRREIKPGSRGFLDALCIPGVIPFALALFFAKLVAYTLIYWGPYYLSHLGFDPAKAAHLAIYFDVGGMIGGLAAGYLSDRWGRRATVAWLFLLMSVPALFFYRKVSGTLLAADYSGDQEVTAAQRGGIIGLNIMVGLFVNGPYALITTAVSADLGTSLGDSKLLATVTGIIDGAGSVGACLQGVLIGIISSYSWDDAFYFLILCCVLSSAMITQLVYRELRTTRCVQGRFGNTRCCRLPGDDDDEEYGSSDDSSGPDGEILAGLSAGVLANGKSVH